MQTLQREEGLQRQQQKSRERKRGLNREGIKRGRRDAGGGCLGRKKPWGKLGKERKGKFWTYELGIR